MYDDADLPLALLRQAGFDVEDFDAAEDQALSETADPSDRLACARQLIQLAFSHGIGQWTAEVAHLALCICGRARPLDIQRLLHHDFNLEDWKVSELHDTSEVKAGDRIKDDTDVQDLVYLIADRVEAAQQALMEVSCDEAAWEALEQLAAVREEVAAVEKEISIFLGKVRGEMEPIKRVQVMCCDVMQALKDLRPVLRRLLHEAWASASFDTIHTMQETIASLTPALGCYLEVVRFTQRYPCRIWFPSEFTEKHLQCVEGCVATSVVF